MTNKSSRKPKKSVTTKSLKEKKSTNASKNKTGKTYKNKANVPKILPIINDINEDEIELSEEDVEFFKEHDQFTGFLKNIDKVAIHRNKFINIKKPSLKPVRNNKDSLPSLTSSEEDDDEMIMEGELDREKMYISSNSDTEQEYEKIPRSNKAWIQKEQTKLPIKLPDGKIKQREFVKEVRNDEDEEKNSSMSIDQEESSSNNNEQSDFAINDKKSQALEHTSDTNITDEEYISQKKEQMAEIAQLIIEDPEENIGQLKTLREMASDKNLTVKKLVLITQLVVYKDIIPGYRIRQLTDKEKSAQVSKAVKKIWNFEQSLLANYQSYLQSLEEELKVEKKKSLRNKSVNITEEKCIAEEALQCMCNLLTSVTHFNFRLNLMTAIVTRMSARKFTKMSAMCCDAIIEVFKNDESGEASLDAVKLITKMTKSRGYVVHEEVLNTFLHLRLRDELNMKTSHEDEVNPNVKDKKRKLEKQEPKKHLSRKMKKLEKERKKVEKEMKEAEAVVDKEEKDKTHTETLKLVFVTYFRILKHANKSPLLLSVLEGLAKFAHLINVDFFNDLLELLKKIMIDDTKLEDSDLEESNAISFTYRIKTRRSLLCIITAFQLLSGQGEALNIDLKDFYTQMYAILLPLALNPYIEKNEHYKKLNDDEGKIDNVTRVETEQELLMKGFDFMFFKRRQIPIDRSAAFLKRLSIACMNWPSKTVLICLNKMEKMIQRQSRLDALLTSDDKAANGIYRPELNDPELCNPFATSLWELNLLQRHYDPKVRAAAVQLATYESNSSKPVNKVL
ncbi:nucleolar complex-associated protein [Glomus cerebriforme]|uniref:Nucleolar complex-associated protein 3 n=1 Tax=Glomus cerebriforme TaxID=658196 RepID=A0A397TFC4_9GLOM|nr:nucleolar complex-associated protein [Glomus cerebriforme]